MLNLPSTVNNNAIKGLPQIECNVLLEDFPTVTETRKAIQYMYSGKAPGVDVNPDKVYKAGGLSMELFQCMWRKETLEKDEK